MAYNSTALNLKEYIPCKIRVEFGPAKTGCDEIQNVIYLMRRVCEERPSAKVIIESNTH